MKHLRINILRCALAGAAALIPASFVSAQDEPPPLPLHGIEGYGGIFSTYSAYVVNPPPKDQILGLPALGFSYVNLGHGRVLSALTVTETIWDRVELGYGFHNFTLGDLGEDVFAATGMHCGTSAVNMNNFNLRANVLQENQFGQKWLPAFTVGAHFKYNADTKDINKHLQGTLDQIGAGKDHGVDFTFYFSKMIADPLPVPVIINAGLRATEAAHVGLLGFSDHYAWLFEGSMAVMPTSNWIVAAEFRQKPDQYTAIPGLIEPEDDWVTVDVAYIINSHMTVAAGYGHFGEVLNHTANGSWGLTFKYEF